MSPAIQVAAIQIPAIPIAAGQIAAGQIAAGQIAAGQIAAGHADAPGADPARFIVGQDPEGHWVAIEIHGRAGGLFRTRKAAVDYAVGETDHRPDAVLLSGGPVALRL